MGNQMQKSSNSDSTNQKPTRFSFAINNFSEKKADISSSIFVSGGCKWYVTVHPEGTCSDHFGVYLNVASPELLRTGWKRRANFCFSLLNQSGKELHKRAEACLLFGAEATAWGSVIRLPLSKLKEEGCLENNKLIINFEVKVVEVVHEGKLTENEMFDIQGFQVFHTQVPSVSMIFAKHPDIAVDFRPKDKSVKTAYMNLLLSLINTMCKPPQSFSETELSNAHNELSELKEAGFKLDWLETKLGEVSLKRKNDGSRVEEMEERIKNLELTLSDLKVELHKEKAKSAADAKVLLFEDIV